VSDVGVPKLLRRPNPKIADVQCSRYVPQPGDRILVRVFRKLSRDEGKKIRRSIEKWAGKDVEVLIYDATKLEVSVDKSGRATSKICSSK